MLVLYLKCEGIVFSSSSYSFLVGVILQLLKCFSSLSYQFKLPWSLRKANLICTWIIFFLWPLEDNVVSGL